MNLSMKKKQTQSCSCRGRGGGAAQMGGSDQQMQRVCMDGQTARSCCVAQGTVLSIVTNNNGREYEKEDIYTHIYTHTIEPLCQITEIKATL